MDGYARHVIRNIIEQESQYSAEEEQEIRQRYLAHKHRAGYGIRTRREFGDYTNKAEWKVYESY